MRSLLNAAASAETFTVPQLFATPDGFPFFVAICLVNSRKGCVPPPNLLGRRVSVGRGSTQAEAGRVALAEAAERYSIQFCSDMPERLHPIRTVGGDASPIAAAEITIGAPGYANTSIGAAAGEDIDDATGRAALELLEHFHLDAFREGAGDLRVVDLSRVAAVRPHLAWLSGQFRVLDCRAAWFAEGYAVAACACADPDGGRRAEGSAARRDLQSAVLAAAEEAIFLWRNMIEIERRGADLSAMTEEDRAAIARYRGASPPQMWPAPIPLAPRVRKPHRAADAGALLAALADRSGRRVRVFDLTVPAVGVPVVKAVLG